MTASMSAMLAFTNQDSASAADAQAMGMTGRKGGTSQIGACQNGNCYLLINHTLAWLHALAVQSRGSCQTPLSDRSWRAAAAFSQSTMIAVSPSMIRSEQDRARVDNVAD